MCQTAWKKKVTMPSRFCATHLIKQTLSFFLWNGFIFVAVTGPVSLSWLCFLCLVYFWRPKYWSQNQSHFSRGLLSQENFTTLDYCTHSPFRDLLCFHTISQKHAWVSCEILCYTQSWFRFAQREEQPTWAHWFYSSTFLLHDSNRCLLR